MIDDIVVYRVRYRRDWRLLLRIVLGVTVGIPIRCVEVLMSFVADTFRCFVRACRYILEVVNQKLPFPEPRFYDADGNEVHGVNYELDEDGNLTIHE